MEQFAEGILGILKLFCFLGVVGVLYYIVLVVVGLANIGTMISGAIGIFILYCSFFGEVPPDLPATFWIWNPYCLVFSPIFAVATIVLIWQFAE